MGLNTNVEYELNCPKCGKKHIGGLDADEENKLKCSCGKVILKVNIF